MASKEPRRSGRKPAVTAAPRAAKPAAPTAPKVEAAAPIVEQKPAIIAPAADTAVATIEAAAATVDAQDSRVVEEQTKLAEAATDVAQAAVETIRETTETVAPAVEEATMIHVNEPVNKAQNLFAEMNDRTKAAMEKSAKSVEDMTEFAKGNVEAMVEASRIAASGLQSMGQDAAEFGRKNLESATQTMKTLATVKSPTEFFKLQSDYLRGAFDAFVAESSKSTEAMLKLAGDAAQPISNRVAVAADKMKVTA